MIYHLAIKCYYLDSIGFWNNFHIKTDVIEIVRTCSMHIIKSILKYCNKFKESSPAVLDSINVKNILEIIRMLPILVVHSYT